MTPVPSRDTKPRRSFAFQTASPVHTVTVKDSPIMNIRIPSREAGIILATLLIHAPAGQAEPRSLGRVPKATVIIDPQDRQNIKGNTSIALVWGRGMKAPYRNYRNTVINLTRSMNMWTKVHTSGLSNLELASELLLDIPFAIITSEEEFVLTPPERMNVRRYLENGGLLFCDNAIGTAVNSPVEKSFRRLIEDALGPETVTKPLPPDHPIFHSFFDFEGVPKIRDGSIIRYGPLVGFWHKERLVAIFSNMGYTVKWSESKANILQLKMGVNMIIFALIREGGLAARE